jgi:hypothetical protein
MDYEVYCDESRPDLLTSSKPNAQYMIIGSIWIEAYNRIIFKREINRLKEKWNIQGEIKWSKIAPTNLHFYKELVEWFFQKKLDLRFRCILVDRTVLNFDKYHKNDKELGFYKFYYQVLHHWVEPSANYRIFVDYKSTRLQNRLVTLHDCIANANQNALIYPINAIESTQSVLIQLTDILTGVVSSKMNNISNTSMAKREVVDYTSQFAKICPSSKNELKFNLFKIRLSRECE